MSEYPRHPGYRAEGCALRLTVSHIRSDGSGGGYGCSYTGGHCVPDEKCDKRREYAAKEKREDAIYVG